MHELLLLCDSPSVTEIERGTFCNYVFCLYRYVNLKSNEMLSSCRVHLFIYSTERVKKRPQVKLPLKIIKPLLILSTVSQEITRFIGIDQLFTPEDANSPCSSLPLFYWFHLFHRQCNTVRYGEFRKLVQIRPGYIIK